jgi:hypothetical protein
MNDKSKCAKCSHPGILVGRNFRHCKTDKEWKELEQKYKDNEWGLYKVFFDYPREGNDETAQKLKNRSSKNRGCSVKLYDC